MLVPKEQPLQPFIKMTDRVFGLTGGIGSGKTTLANLLKKLDNKIEIFDCDEVAKKITEEKKTKKEIIKIFRDGILDKGKLNRKKIAEIIFDNPGKKEEIEKLIHPQVWVNLDKMVKKSKERTIVLVESAILVDTGKQKDIPKVIVTICDKEIRKERVKKRSNLDETEIEKRMKNQMKDEDLIKKAWITIDTNCSLSELRIKAKKLYLYLLEGQNKKINL